MLVASYTGTEVLPFCYRQLSLVKCPLCNFISDWLISFRRQVSEKRHTICEHKMWFCEILVVMMNVLSVCRVKTRTVCDLS